MGIPVATVKTLPRATLLDEKWFTQRAHQAHGTEARSYVDCKLIVFVPKQALEGVMTIHCVDSQQLSTFMQ